MSKSDPIRQDMLCSLGYRCIQRSEMWVAAFNPVSGRITINPSHTTKRVRQSLPEELTHAVSVLYRPAQVYPLTGYLEGKLGYPDVEEFRDIVEAVHMAFHPLLRDHPVWPSRAAQGIQPFHDQARRIIQVSTQYATGASRSVPVDTAQRRSLWAVTMFLLYIVPAIPRQCSVVLDVLLCIDPPAKWRTSAQLFQHLFTEVSSELARMSAIRPHRFLLAAPIGVHRDISLTLDLIREAVSTPIGDLTPIFPPLLSAATFAACHFIPVSHVTRTDDGLECGFELWDRTKRCLTDKLSVARQLRSAELECPGQRFHAGLLNAVARACARPRRCGPATVWSEAMKAIRQLIKQELRPLWKSQNVRCSECQRFLSHDSVRENATAIYDAKADLLAEITSAFREYGHWLTSVGLRQIERSLDLPQGTCRPYLIPGRAQHRLSVPVFWRKL